MEPGTLKIRDSLDYLVLFGLEAFGSFVLLCGISMANGLDSAPMVVGATIFMVVCFIGRITGAHMNGSVSLTIYLVEGKWAKNLVLLGLYLVADLVGSYLGLLTAWGLKGGNHNVWVLKPGHRDSAYSVFDVLLVEMYFTTLFMTAVMHVKYSKISSTGDGVLAPLAIIIALYSIIS
jgi:glycerol uptake facilitator-like aquaporin